VLDWFCNCVDVSRVVVVVVLVLVVGVVRGSFRSALTCTLPWTVLLLLLLLVLLVEEGAEAADVRVTAASHLHMEESLLLNRAISAERSP
jgi:hypothetical protein